MKNNFSLTACLLTVFVLTLSACKKDKKKETPPSEPPVATPTPQEVVTTLRVYIWDSLTNAGITGSPFSFKDPDGDGGSPGGFLNNSADSLIVLEANKIYRTKIVILDETKSPADSISKEIAGDEGYEHMFFYNGDPLNNMNFKGNTILIASYPNYTVRLNGCDIRLRYTDTDNGAAHGQPARNIGLTTILKTGLSTGGASYPFIATLRHQPGAKDGTYSPGETDVKVAFKVKVN